MTRRIQKFIVFMKSTDYLSTLSTCKRAQCGAIVFPYDMSRILAIGYNGPPRRAPNDSCTGEEGQCGCIHAETNAIIKLDTPKDELLMYSTTMPCPACAGLIANCSKIRYMFYNRPYRIERGVAILRQANIEVYQTRDLMKLEEILENL